jgi:anti-anti-sigma regulatory factor
MSFHFCTHPWEVRDVANGLQVTLTRHDLDPTADSSLVEDLYELILESGQRDLYLDFGEIPMAPSVIIGQVVALNAKLGERGGRLIVINLDPAVHDTFRATRIGDVLELRLRQGGDTDAGSAF